MHALQLAHKTLLAIVALTATGIAAPPPTFPAGELQRPFFGTQDTTVTPSRTSKRVHVRFGVMSRCPDALFCEATLDRVLDRVNSKVHLEALYLAKPNASAPFGASCLHGDVECAGNVHQLCVQHALRPSVAGKEYDLSPSAAQLKWWDVLTCMNYARARIGEDALVQECLRTVRAPAPSWDGPGGIGECVHGKLGRTLLARSLKESNRLGIVNSCTILIGGDDDHDGGSQCVRDGGVWKRCTIPGGHDVGDFVAEIEAQYDRLNKDEA